MIEKSFNNKNNLMDTKEKLIIVGIGGMAPEVVDFVTRYDLYDIVAFSVDSNYIKSPTYMNCPVYPLEDLESYVSLYDAKLFVAISWYNYLNRYKRQKFETLKAKGFHFANLISPLASVNCSSMGEGNWIQDFAYLGYQSEIGNNNTFCSHSLLGHYSVIGNHNVLSGRASVAGNNQVGDQNYFGMCSSVFNKLVLGNKNLIGGGSIVKKNIGNCTIVTAPDSKFTQATEKAVEFCLSPKSVEIVNNVLDK